MYWMCFKTNSRKEFLAKNCLISKGFKVILPYYIKTIRHARKISKIPYPIFPSYGFLFYDGDTSSLLKIKYTQGIKHYLRRNDGEPQFIPNKIIDGIESLKQNDGTYRLDEECFQLGDEVNIIEGSFIGIKAIFKQRIDEWRAQLLVNFLGRINKVTLNTRMIEHI